MSPLQSTKNGIEIAKIFRGYISGQRCASRIRTWEKVDKMDFSQNQRQKNRLRTSLPEHFHSVEFVVQSPHPIYQFKLWRSECNQVFLLIKDNSTLLRHLKVGNILPMTYHCCEAAMQTEVCNTQIENIVNEQEGRFRGHHRVELAIVPREKSATVQ